MKKQAFLSKALSKTPTVTAAVTLCGFVLGIFIFLTLGYSFFGYEKPPLCSAFSLEKPLVMLVSDFASEIKYFILMAVAAYILKRAYPVFCVIFLRAFLFGFSSTYLYGMSDAVLVYFLFSAISSAVIISYAVMGTRVIFYTKSENKRRLFHLFFEFMFYTGIIFLLVIIKNLIYLLI